MPNLRIRVHTQYLPGGHWLEDDEGDVIMKHAYTYSQSSKAAVLVLSLPPTAKCDCQLSTQLYGALRSIGLL